MKVGWLLGEQLMTQGASHSGQEIKAVVACSEIEVAVQKQKDTVNTTSEVEVVPPIQHEVWAYQYCTLVDLGQALHGEDKQQEMTREEHLLHTVVLKHLLWQLLKVFLPLLLHSVQLIHQVGYLAFHKFQFRLIPCQTSHLAPW